ncbi:MAG: phosphopantetheine-binding protein [Thiohalocapsa sp.]
MSDTVNVLSEMIIEVLADAPLEPITRDTSFGNDLEFESIELVSLAEKIQSRYGDKANIADWLSRKDLDELIKLKVGDLADFIDQCLASNPSD